VSIDLIPTKLNVEASWQRYIDLLHELQSQPALNADEQHSKNLQQAELEWADLFQRWSVMPTETKRLSA
jgi:hypothetical protein